MWIVIIEMLRISCRYPARQAGAASSEAPYVATKLDGSALPQPH